MNLHESPIASKGILDMPNEILDDFMENLAFSKDVASASLSCRKVHSVAQRHLYRCIAWDPYLGVFCTALCWDLPAEGCFSGYLPPIDLLLRSFASNADVAHCVQELSFQFPGRPHGEVNNFKVSKGAPNRLIRSDIENIKQSSRLQAVQEKEVHWAALESGSGSEIAHIVVLLCANLRRLRISSFYDYPTINPSFIGSLIEQDPGPLTHVEYLYLQEPISAECASRVFQFPNLEGLEVSIKSTRTFVWPTLPLLCAPLLTKLDLLVEHWEPGLLANILSATPHLQELQYQFAPWLEGEQDREDSSTMSLHMDEVYHALLLVAETLQKLEIHVSVGVTSAIDLTWGDYWGMDHTLGSLASFRALKSMRIPLLGLACGSSPYYSHLQSHLPPNLRSLYLTPDCHSYETCDLDNRDCLRLLKDLLHNWKVRLPELQTVGIPRYYQKDMRELFEQNDHSWDGGLRIVDRLAVWGPV
ncbi:hypothetical protein BCR34DRAFT_570694 [Clohesyomyces aquaticus]|uniref:F-box domain-containing protein n=1 Tax=Clohesyomyces aquaticus TaxID=1231657 RepID=A0A1Y1ZAX4_9PLEO|nr:hypothetical protein BCR34DRAFT_570694 [Clohesyomyces aquaticus]